MEEALRFLRAYEIWIYTFLAIGGLIYVRKLLLTWEEFRQAAFGLEQESAKSRLNQAASMLFLFISLGIGVFVLVSLIGPGVPIANPLLTPTLDLLATATTTLPAEFSEREVGAEPLAPQPADLPENAREGCEPGRIMLVEPEAGSEVSDVVTLTGTASIPNFGFYKYEVQRLGDPIWLTIQAWRTPKVDDELGTWDTRALPSGDYLLRLVVTDNEGNTLPACVIDVRINNP